MVLLDPDPFGDDRALRTRTRKRAKAISESRAFGLLVAWTFVAIMVAAVLYSIITGEGDGGA